MLTVIEHTGVSAGPADTCCAPGSSARISPIITFRGQFCYVALPGRTHTRWLRRPRTDPPSPVLRLRYQGNIDHWKIAIYKYSSESYTEAELPTSFGPVTGTPEEGVNRTFPLYAGPRRKP
ncbi:MAG: hypothetical protein JXA67_02100 [Micromonosporaceae bacterium]|nr:hypothetical protein [Micromonosporaceae bacterium]